MVRAPLYQLPERVDFLSERPDADVVVVGLLADDAEVFRQGIDQQLLVRERLPVRFGLLIEAGRHRFERFGQRRTRLRGIGHRADLG